METDIGLFSDAVSATHDNAKLNVVVPHAPKKAPPFIDMLEASFV